TSKRTVSLFFVTTSPFWKWVICAPAAFLGCGSRFSGSLSGVEPLFSVTRYYHGRRITYHRKLIRQTLERYVAGTRTVRSAKLFRFTKLRALWARLVFILINALESCETSFFARISSRIATVIRVGY